MSINKNIDITAAQVASGIVHHDVSTNISPASENREKKFRAGHVNNVLSFSSSCTWDGDNLSSDEDESGASISEMSYRFSRLSIEKYPLKKVNGE